MNMEIVVQRNARSAIFFGEIQNCGVYSPIKSDLTDVERVPTCQCGGAASARRAKP